MLKKVLNVFLNPQRLILKLWHRFPAGSFQTRLEYDIFERPHYAFCLYHAARLAHRLGHKRISVMEFGVAGGRGVMALEKLAVEVAKIWPVEIEVYGFDTGEGLPEPVDYRDLPYIWKSGFYKMDQDALKAKLSRTKLVLGDVKDTVPEFFKNNEAAPLGAAFFDLDFYSSTVDSLKIFDGAPETMLPRVFCYCDDVISAETGGLLNEYVGQLLAIEEYNARESASKLTKIAGFPLIRRLPARWNDQIYVHHRFDHPDYDTYVHDDQNRQLPI